MKAFRSRLKELIRQKYGYMSHQQLADSAGIDRRETVTRWMSDKPMMQLNMKVLEPLANFLECDVIEMVEVIEIEESV